MTHAYKSMFSPTRDLMLIGILFINLMKWFLRLFSKGRNINQWEKKQSPTNHFPTNQVTNQPFPNHLPTNQPFPNQPTNQQDFNAQLLSLLSASKASLFQLTFAGAFRRQGAKCMHCLATRWHAVAGPWWAWDDFFFESMFFLENHYALHNTIHTFTLQETNISHLGKRKIIFKSALVGDKC